MKKKTSRYHNMLLRMGNATSRHELTVGTDVVAKVRGVEERDAGGYRTLGKQLRLPNHDENPYHGRRGLV
jgi:hypothetical protein